MFVSRFHIYQNCLVDMELQFVGGKIKWTASDMELHVSLRTILYQIGAAAHLEGCVSNVVLNIGIWSARLVK